MISRELLSKQQQSDYLWKFNQKIMNKILTKINGGGGGGLSQ